MGSKVGMRRLNEKHLLLKCPIFCLGLITGPMPDAEDFHFLLLGLDAIEDAVIETEDFPCSAMAVTWEGSADVGEAAEDLHMINQSLADFDRGLGVLLGDVITNQAKVAYCWLCPAYFVAHDSTSLTASS